MLFDDAEQFVPGCNTFLLSQGQQVMDVITTADYYYIFYYVLYVHTIYYTYHLHPVAVLAL